MIIIIYLTLYSAKTSNNTHSFPDVPNRSGQSIGRAVSAAVVVPKIHYYALKWS